MSNSPAETPISVSIRLKIVSRQRLLEAEAKHRLPPDTTSRTRWALMAFTLIGLAQGTYFSWAANSSMAAAPIFHGSPSCQPPSFAALQAKLEGACRLERATVIDAGYTSSRRSDYYILTTTATGQRERTTIARRNDGLALWRRVRPNQRVILQRFVAPGYYITGNITAFADSVGYAMTRYHPDSGTHYESMYAIVGMLLFACCFCLYFFGSRTGGWKRAAGSG